MDAQFKRNHSQFSAYNTADFHPTRFETDVCREVAEKYDAWLIRRGFKRASWHKDFNCKSKKAKA